MSGRELEREEDLAAVVRAMRTIAVVGIKDARDPDAAAYTVPEMLAAAGHRILGVNPFVPEALGARTLSSVADLPAGVDVVDVYRRSDALPGLADELLALPAERRPRLVWLQSGIRHDGAAARLVAGGYDVVQDRCLGVYERRYRGPQRT